MISLVGNVVKDIISDSNSIHFEYGGIISVAKSIIDTSKDLEVCLSPISIGSANISINKEKKEKTVNFVDLNEYNFSIPKIDCEWEHISYLNKSNSYIPNNSNKIVTADLCKGDNISAKQCKNVDILLFSTEEFGHGDDLEHLQKYGNYLISHNPFNISLYKSYKKIFSLDNLDIIKNCNILGAGDYFCGQFIKYAFQHRSLILENIEIMANCISSAHYSTIVFLNNREKI